MTSPKHPLQDFRPSIWAIAPFQKQTLLAISGAKNGTSDARRQQRRPLFPANNPLKWWISHSFHMNITSGGFWANFIFYPNDDEGDFALHRWELGTDIICSEHFWRDSASPLSLKQRQWWKDVRGPVAIGTQQVHTGFRSFSNMSTKGALRRPVT